jgi:MFS family permease
MNPDPNEPPLSDIELQAGDSATRQSLRLVMISWLFGAAWMYLTMGALFTRFTKLLDTSPFGYGLLVAAPFLGVLMQLPGSYIADRSRNLKSIFINAGIAHRLSWLVIALIPWFVPSDWQWIALAVLICASSMLGNLIGPIWMIWMGGLVPASIRGRYFSRRIQLGQVVGFIVTITTALVLDQSAASGDRYLRWITSGALSLAAILGVVDFLLFLKVTPPVYAPPATNTSFWQEICVTLKDANFRRFLRFTGGMSFATGFVGQYLWLFMFDVVDCSNTKATLLIMIFPMLSSMLAYPVWGRILDRVGRKPILIISGLCIIPGSIVWLPMNTEYWWIGYIGVLLVTFAWPGMDLSNFNILLGMTGQSSKSRNKGSIFIGINSLVTAVGGLLSGLFAGTFAHFFADFTFTVLGMVITYHGLLFIVSMFLRMLALSQTLNLDEPTAYRTRDALDYLGANIYSNIQQVVILPVRIAANIGRWTYKTSSIFRRRK